MKKCPNCAGEMSMDSEIGMFICPYCDTQLPIPEFHLNQASNTNQTNATNNQNIAITSKLFVIRRNDFNDSGKEGWEILCSSLNSGKTSEQLKEDMLQIAMNKQECATYKWNLALRDKILQKVSHLFTPGEAFLLYKDSGTFSKGKEGILITNQKTIFIKKNKFRIIMHSQIRKLEKSSIFYSWRLNGDSDYWFDTIGCTNIELGRILAYLCMKCYETNPPNHKIVIDII